MNLGNVTKKSVPFRFPRASFKSGICFQCSTSLILLICPKKSAIKFAEKADCYVGQYSQYHILEADLYVNWRPTAIYKYGKSMVF